MTTEKPKTCYVTFEANTTKEYAYHCGDLLPAVGHYVVIQLNDYRLKLVKCVRLEAAVDPKSTKEIFAILQEQPTNV